MTIMPRKTQKKIHNAKVEKEESVNAIEKSKEEIKVDDIGKFKEGEKTDEIKKFEEEKKDILDLIAYLQQLMTKEEDENNLMTSSLDFIENTVKQLKQTAKLEFKDFDDSVIETKQCFGNSVIETKQCKEVPQKVDALKKLFVEGEKLETQIKRMQEKSQSESEKGQLMAHKQLIDQIRKVVSIFRGLVICNHLKNSQFNHIHLIDFCNCFIAYLILGKSEIKPKESRTQAETIFEYFSTITNIINFIEENKKYMGFNSDDVIWANLNKDAILKLSSMFRPFDSIKFTAKMKKKPRNMADVEIKEIIQKLLNKVTLASNLPQAGNLAGNITILKERIENLKTANDHFSEKVTLIETTLQSCSNINPKQLKDLKVSLDIIKQFLPDANVTFLIQKGDDIYPILIDKLKLLSIPQRIYFYSFTFRDLFYPKEITLELNIYYTIAARLAESYVDDINSGIKELSIDKPLSIDKLTDKIKFLSFVCYTLNQLNLINFEENDLKVKCIKLISKHPSLLIYKKFISKKEIIANYAVLDAIFNKLNLKRDANLNQSFDKTANDMIEKLEDFSRKNLQQPSSTNDTELNSLKSWIITLRNNINEKKYFSKAFANTLGSTINILKKKKYNFTDIIDLEIVQYVLLLNQGSVNDIDKLNALLSNIEKSSKINEARALTIQLLNNPQAFVDKIVAALHFILLTILKIDVECENTTDVRQEMETATTLLDLIISIDKANRMRERILITLNPKSIALDPIDVLIKTSHGICKRVIETTITQKVATENAKVIVKTEERVKAEGVVKEQITTQKKKKGKSNGKVIAKAEVDTAVEEVAPIVQKETAVEALVAEATSKIKKETAEKTAIVAETPEKELTKREQNQLKKKKKKDKIEKSHKATSEHMRNDQILYSQGKADQKADKPVEKELTPYQIIETDVKINMDSRILKVISTSKEILGKTLDFQILGIRNLVMNARKGVSTLKANDIDIFTDCKLEDIQSILKEQKIESLITPGNIQTLKFKITDSTGEEEVNVDICSFRKNPLIKQGSQDLGDKDEHMLTIDFTVNLFRFNPEKMIVEACACALQDLDRRLLKIVGNAEERVNNDWTLILRGLRFKASYDFTIDDDTKFAFENRIKSMNELFEQKTQSKEEFDRVKRNKGILSTNINKAFFSGSGLKCFNELEAFKLLPVIFPKFSSEDFTKIKNKLDEIDKTINQKKQTENELAELQTQFYVDLLCMNLDHSKSYTVIQLKEFVNQTRLFISDDVKNRFYQRAYPKLMGEDSAKKQHVAQKLSPSAPSFVPQQHESQPQQLPPQNTSTHRMPVGMYVPVAYHQSRLFTPSVPDNNISGEQKPQQQRGNGK